MLAATFWERLQEAPVMFLRILGMLLLIFLCFGIVGFAGLTIWSVFTKRLRIPGSVIGASILASISVWWGWAAVQQYAYTKAIRATGESPDPTVPVDQACRDLNGDARKLAFFALIFAGFAIWLIWQWRQGVERKRLLNMTEQERLAEKAKDAMSHG